MCAREKTLIKPEGALVDLNVNPCKMCMPMGAVTAAYGVKGCMSILHGSQGCATYIRRHMATHYNEPIDIASSALTEQGTVYGGEENLKKGIDNLIKLYNPRAIAVATTCLAETIGEDVAGILDHWRADHPQSEITFIPVATPGYGGTQFEGYFRFLHALVKNVVPQPDLALPHQLNIVCGPMSPADMRALKDLVELFDIEAVFIPDIGDNLDRARLDTYHRLPEGGSTIEQIATMAGAALTIEIATFLPGEYSPGTYLEETHGVPCVRLNLPVGLRDIDAFIDALAEFSQQDIPQKITEARGRYLDAMIDSHKYNAQGRAAIFGEPDFCYAVARMCVEEGIVPVVVAAGSRSPDLAEALRDDIKMVAENLMIDDWRVVDRADFGDIERLAVEMGANVLIGSSDGRRVAEKCGIPLVRCAFPVHDHVGGQRVRMLGYEGSLVLLDRITNLILQRVETTFRSEIRREFLDETPLAQKSSATLSSTHAEAVSSVKKKKPHPCFDGSCAAEHGRIHLPVAPACNISCNYCLRRFDCPNESRPGVTSAILTPEEAFERYVKAKKLLPNLSVVGIAGPGDALADWDKTERTLEYIRAYDDDVVFCLSTNGLLLPRYADRIAELGVSHVTVTMNAVDPDIGAHIYRSVRLDGVSYVGAAGAAVLLSNQLAGIKRLVELGVTVKVNCVLIAGINEDHVRAVATKAAELGVSVQNIMQMIPVPGSAFGDLPQVTLKTLQRIRTSCEGIVSQMYHCHQCRADAAGLLGDDRSYLLAEEAPTALSLPNQQPSAVWIKVAVASRSGIMVDQHFGQADEFLIYETDANMTRYLERRGVKRYCQGSEACDDHDDRTARVIETLSDCDAVLSLRIGQTPMRALCERDILPVVTCDGISAAVIEAAKRVFTEKEVSEDVRDEESQEALCTILT